MVEYEKIEPNVWKPTEDGEQLEGKLVSREENVGPNDSTMYFILTDKEEVRVWGTTVLNSKMKFVEVGDMVRITYKGSQKNPHGQPTKIFEVEKEKKIPDGDDVPEEVVQ